MIVKYYGRERRDFETGEVTQLSSIFAYTKLSTEELTAHIEWYEKGASVWLVPGTFDGEGRHVG